MSALRWLLLVVVLLAGWMLTPSRVPSGHELPRVSQPQRSPTSSSDSRFSVVSDHPGPELVQGHGFQRTLKVFAERGHWPGPYHGKDALGKNRVIFPREVMVPLEAPFGLDAYANGDSSRRLHTEPNPGVPGSYLISVPTEVSDVDFVSRGFARRCLDVSQPLDGRIRFVPNARIKVSFSLPPRTGYEFTCALNSGADSKPALLFRRHVGASTQAKQPPLELRVPSHWPLTLKLKPRFGDAFVWKVEPLDEGEDRLIHCNLTEASNSFCGQLVGAPPHWLRDRQLWLSCRTGIASLFVSSHSTTSDSEGRFEFPGIAAGLDFSLRLTGADQEAILLSDETGNAMFRGPSQEVVRMDCSELTGVMVTRRGKVIERFVIHAERHHWESAFDQSNGIGLLAMGNISKFDNAWLVVDGGGSTQVNLAHQLKPRQIVSLEVGKSHRLTVQLKTSISKRGARVLRLYVVDAAGEQLSGVKSDGQSWSFDLSPGQYSLLWCCYGGGTIPAHDAPIMVQDDVDMSVTPPELRHWKGVVDNWHDLPPELHPYGISWGGDHAMIKDGKFEIESLSDDLEQLRLLFGAFGSGSAESRISGDRLHVRIKTDSLCHWELIWSEPMPKKWGQPVIYVRDGDPCRRYAQFRMNGWERYGNIEKVGKRGQRRAGFVALHSRHGRYLVGWFDAALRGAQCAIPLNSKGRWVSIQGHRSSALQVYACGPKLEMPPAWLGGLGTGYSHRFWVPTECTALEFVRLGEQKVQFSLRLDPQQSLVSLN